MDEDDTPAAAGLRKIVAALARQLDATRQQLLTLQDQRHRKEALLRAGRQVLEQHCAASWAGDATAAPPRATLAAAAPTPAGWRIAVTVDSLPPGAGVAVVVVHCEVSGGYVVRQTGSDGTAIVRPLSGGGSTSGEAHADVFAVVTSPVDPGVPIAALYAGRARLDAASWLRALAGGGGGGSDGLHDAATVWPHAARFRVHGAQEDAVQEALERELGCVEGVSTAGDGERTWSLGRAGEVRYRADGGFIALEILGDTQELVWAVKSEVEAALQATAAAGGTRLPQWTVEAGLALDTTLTDALDALLAEIDALTAWVGALKARAADSGATASTSTATAQAAAVEAMIRTDRAALRVPTLSSNSNK